MLRYLLPFMVFATCSQRPVIHGQYKINIILIFPFFKYLLNVNECKDLISTLVIEITNAICAGK